ncbi:amt3, partial [Symbiodinium sp. CCMP2456]
MSGFAYPILAESVWGDSQAQLSHAIRGGRYLQEVADVYSTISRGDSVLGSNFRDSAAGHSYYDYAGGGVVHLAGGVAALVGNLMVGRRILRPPVKDFLPKTTESAESSNSGDWDCRLLCRPEEKNRVGDRELLTETWHRRFDNPEDDEKEFRANSYLQIMGIFNLWVGCYGFNACPAFLRNDRSSFADASLATWNTTLAASAGALGAFLHQHLFQERMDIGFLCNGVLSGLVASTACCDVLFTILATGIGFLAGFVVYPAGSYLLRRLRVDDPADAIAVHGGGGLFSVTVAAFSHPDCTTHAAHALCHSGRHWGWQLLAQLRGAAVIIAWTTAVVTPVWALFLLSETIRSLELEELVAFYERLCDSELGVVSKQEPALQSAAQRSWIVRRLLRHSSVDLHDLREDVLDAIHDTKTALEMESRVVRLFLGIAKVLRRCRLIRDVCRLRLRIPPFAELVGLGALSKEGSTVADASRGVLSSSAERSNEEAAIPLRLQLERLNRQVQNQGILLQRLSRGRRHSGWRRSNLYSVAEVSEPTAQEEANVQ